MSDTIRWYLEERFDFHAPERTTEEFLYELQGTNLLTPDQKDSLGEFLKRCDLVKFAKYEPGEPELHDLHDSAMRLVEETEPQSWQQRLASQSKIAGRKSQISMTFGHPYFLLLLLLLPVLALAEGQAAASRRLSSIRRSNWCAGFSM